MLNNLGLNEKIGEGEGKNASKEKKKASSGYFDSEEEYVIPAQTW